MYIKCPEVKKKKKNFMKNDSWKSYVYATHKPGTVFFLSGILFAYHMTRSWRPFFFFFLFVAALKPLKKKKKTTNFNTRPGCKCWLFVWHITSVLKYVAGRASGLNIDVGAVKKKKKKKWIKQSWVFNVRI